MAIVNATPDSFYQKSRLQQLDEVCFQVEKFLQQGASIIDVGGESSRPGALEVTESEELERVIPLIDKISQRFNCSISIDTRKANVMRQAVNAGASMINDINALQAENAIEVAASLNVPICLMHMQGEPDNMQQSPSYKNVVEEVMLFLQQRIEICENGGIQRSQLIIDPGFGFGKSVQHNLQLLAQLSQFKSLGCSILVGLSRKSILQTLTGKAVEHRLAGTLALHFLAIQNGADMVRVHDVDEMMDVIKVVEAVKQYTTYP